MGVAVQSERKMNVIGGGEDKIISKCLTVDGRLFLPHVIIGVAVRSHSIHRSQRCKFCLHPPPNPS